MRVYRILIAAMALVCSVPAYAQVLYGSLTGTVEDRSGGAVPGATVRIANAETGQSRQTTTSTTGAYTLQDILPGVWTVSVSANGFRSVQSNAIQITINSVTRFDTALDVGNMAESVTVTAEAVALQADKADVHVTVDTRAITQLPLPGYRNYQSLVNLVPGATPGAFQNAVSGSPGRSLVTNINGTTNSNNNTRLDGASNMRASLPHQNLYIPPAESIEVVNVATNSFDADQGFAGGAAVNVTTKSGTNDFHGVIFEHHTNSELKARNFFFLDAKKPKNIINTYGGTLGGPIRKNKLFFFGSYEGLKERSNFSKFATVPDARQRAGDFSASPVTLYDPLTGNADGTGRTPFPGNIIPVERQSEIARKLQALIPLPNQPGTASNYFASAPASFNRENVDAKVNWHKSDETNLWAKYSVMKALVRSQFSLGEAGGTGMINGGGAGTGDVLMQVAAIGGVKTFSPNLLLDGTIAFSRDPLTLVGPDSGKHFGLDYLGIPGTNGPNERYSGIPAFAVAGYDVFGNSETFLPKYIRNTSFTYTASMSWVRGKHEMRFGGDIARHRVNQWHPEIGGGPRGQFNFDGAVTALRGGPLSPNQFNAYAQFLLGLPQAVGKSVQPRDTTPRQWMEGFFFRDRWQATRNLTLTLGLRYEYFPLMTRDDRGIERYDPETNLVYIGGRGSVPNDAGISVSKKLFAPRLGAAWRLGNRMVLRAGYGISVNPYVLSTAESLLFPYPNVVATDFRSSNAYIPFGPLSAGIPPVPYPDINQGVIGIPNSVTTQTLPKGLYDRGYIQSWNVIVERQLPGQFVGSVGYVATRTIRQNIRLNINAAEPGAGENGRPLARAFGRTADTFLIDPRDGAKYDSLQARLDRALAGGMLLKISYTWSKAMNFTDSESGTLMFNAPSAYARNYARAGYDRPQMLRVGWVADLPFGNSKKWLNGGSLAGKLAGGWQVNGIFSAYSGSPFTVTASGASLNAPANSQTADQIKPDVAKLGGIGRNVPFFDPLAFAPVTQVRFGNSGRNILRGPGVVNADASLFRNFRLTERWDMQFRAEAFNVTNTPHFSNPNANVANLSLNGDGTIRSLGNFMSVTSASSVGNNAEGGERQFRFALRLSF